MYLIVVFTKKKLLINAIDAVDNTVFVFEIND